MDLQTPETMQAGHTLHLDCIVDLRLQCRLEEPID
jgi:hypothetical protein